VKLRFSFVFLALWKGSVPSPGSCNFLGLSSELTTRTCLKFCAAFEQCCLESFQHTLGHPNTHLFTCCLPTFVPEFGFVYTILTVLSEGQGTLPGAVWGKALLWSKQNKEVGGWVTALQAGDGESQSGMGRLCWC
jgi:hypothetical protein